MVPDVIVTVAVIVPYSIEVGRQSRAIPVTTILIEGMCPGIAEKVGHAMPWPLIHSHLQPVVVTKVLIGNVVDVREIGEFAEVRPFHIFARSAAGSCGSNHLSWSEWRVARRRRGTGEPAG